MLTISQQIFEQIQKSKNILITFSKLRSGDAISSSLALFLFLKKIGKNAEVVADVFFEDKNFNNDFNLYSFLPEFTKINSKIENLRNFIISLDISSVKANKIKYKVENNNLNFIISSKDGFFKDSDVSSKSSDFKYDLIIVLDSPDLESLGSIYDDNMDFFYQTNIINIDHNSNNEEFGQINFVELNAVSVSEILFSLLEGYSRDIIDEDIATCLLTGIIHKTKSFKTSNITPHALLTTSQLISIGARREEIVNKLYRSRSFGVLKLWGRILARLSGSLDSKIVWSCVSQNDFLKTGTGEEDLRDVIDELIVNIPKALLIVLFYEDGNQQEKSLRTKIISYAVKNIDSLNVLNGYNPEGTKKVAYASIHKSIQETEKEVIEKIKEKMIKLDI